MKNVACAFRQLIVATSFFLVLPDVALAQFTGGGDMSCAQADPSRYLPGDEIYNTTGYWNTACGYAALYLNTTGFYNTAYGAQALYSNTTGSRSTAVGVNALYTSNADDNNALGYFALHNNLDGTLNTAIGSFALEFNGSGIQNNAVGYAALQNNSIGSHNNAQGFYALARNTWGNNNTAIGQYAGYNLTAGNDNIYIGNSGVAVESGRIRIGDPSIHSAAYLAGVTGTVLTGGNVVITASGQLGVASSSRRYKHDIEALGDTSDLLDNLRPIKFRYNKPDESGAQPVHYGLIAEEVAEVVPEIVYRNADGAVEGVRYDELTPMLLKEVQHQRQRILAQGERLAAQEQQLGEQASQLRELKQLLGDLQERDRAMRAEVAAIAASGPRVAMR